MWNQMQMNLSMKEMDLLIQRTDLWLPKGCVWGGGGVLDWVFETKKCKILYRTVKESLTIQCRETYSISCDKPLWKRKKKKKQKIIVCIETGMLCT